MRKMFSIALLAGFAALAIAAEKHQHGKESGQSGRAAGEIREDRDEEIYLRETEVKWGPAPAGLPPGAQAAVIEGDPAKKGVSTLRVKAPKGYRIPAHWHPARERITVLSGTFALGHGDKFDEAALKEYAAGSFLSMPPKMRHFALFKEEAVLQLTVLGPWGITYVNPAEDPRNQETGK